MQFTIRHSTLYRYTLPVRLAPQQLRFHPRGDCAQRVINYDLAIAPTPTGRTDLLDMEGNQVTEADFEGLTDYLEIVVNMQVETLAKDSDTLMLSPEAGSLPPDYGPETSYVSRYLERNETSEMINAFAAEHNLAANGNTLAFLDALTHQLHRDYDHIIRTEGEPQNPVHTLQNQSGACRDLTVLFIDCCRAVGIAARFASGYQKGDLMKDRRFLHAWPEVYLPGAGWRGYDPTHGVITTDSHVTIAAAASPADTMPVTGGFYFTGTEITSTLDFTIDIEATDNSG
jgi:transglutaminase-like putative cysteine protease